ncbi:MAG: FAD:protein FMN transferase [Planctomycetota bacterium]
METVCLATHAMGCRWEFVLAGADLAHLRAAGEEAIESVESAHERLSAFAADSVVSRINASAGKWAERVDAELLGLVLVCESVRTASVGAFDVCVGRVMEAAGYRRSGTELGAESARVGRIEVDRAASTIGLVDARSSIDLGGVGKGFGLDLAVESLREAGVGSAFVHAGTSSVAAVGHRPDGSAWRVALPWGGEVELVDTALSVSGTEVQGAHVVDPRTGEPAADRGPIALMGASAALCDAWSTACFVDESCVEKIPAGYVCLTGSRE